LPAYELLLDKPRNRENLRLGVFSGGASVTDSAKRAQEKPTVPHGLVDTVIVARVRTGEVQLYALLMQRHYARVLELVRGSVGDDELEQALQNVYLHAYERLGEFGGEQPFSDWLLQVVGQDRRRDTALAEVIEFDTARGDRVLAAVMARIATGFSRRSG
jgi:hypothetical protein